MVWDFYLNVQMTASAHRLDLPYGSGHNPSCMCFVQLLQLVCLKLITLLSFCMVGMLLTVAIFLQCLYNLMLLQVLAEHHLNF